MEGWVAARAVLLALFVILTAGVGSAQNSASRLAEWEVHGAVRKQPELAWFRRAAGGFLRRGAARVARFKDAGHSVSDSGYQYETRWFQQELDHFSFTPESFTKWPQRYLIDDKYWTPGGPFFVYCGNEGYIDWFANNTGFMWDIAEEFGALLLFPEHRYYGESMPFGNKSYSTAENRAYLTAEQAIADYAVLIADLKANLSSPDSKVVLFGGSYGGMLAAWMRLKYPHVADGAIAASAPILQFVVPPDTFYRIVSEDFKEESETCFGTIRDSWSVIREIGVTGEGREKLAATFGLCEAPGSAQDVIDWLDDTWGNLAMVDYPVAAGFLAKLPAYPVREVCKAIDLADGPDLQKVAAGTFLFYNYTGDKSCIDISADPFGEDGWNYQACTEMVMPMESNPENSMFEPFKWDGKAFAEECEKQFGVSPRPDWIPLQYGGLTYADALKNFGSNIVFSNGRLDPWRGGAPQETINPTIVAILVKDGAHHYDLRAATDDDPKSVRVARDLEKKWIKTWIAGPPPPAPGPWSIALLTVAAMLAVEGVALLVWRDGVRAFLRRQDESYGLLA